MTQPDDGTRPLNVTIQRSAMTPFVKDDGTPRSALPLPYRPVLNACSICPARCCYMNVRVSLIDAVVYCSTLDVPFFAGLALGSSEHEAHAFPLLEDTRILSHGASWRGRAEIFLRRRSDGGCHALVDIDGYQRCGVYSARPSVCRIYPLTWSSDVARGGPGAVRCPVPYGLTEREQLRTVREIEASILGWEQHDQIVAEWTEGSTPEERTVEAFLAFAVPRAAALGGVSPARMLSGATAGADLLAAQRASGVRP